MQFYTISPVFGLLLLGAFALGLNRAFLMVAAMIPFGMLAVISLPSLGGLSLLAVNLGAAALVTAGVVIFLGRMLRGRPMQIDPAGIALMFFAAYAVFSATVLVRLFAGETMVFSLARDATGVRVSTFFSWGKVWLGPSSSNISQTFYILLASAYFLAASHVLRRYGPGLGAQAMAIAAVINIGLGLLDLAALDGLLDLIRTANYSLANEATVNGMPRVIGGYSEAASFGAASAMFFGYFASAFTYSGRTRDGLIALGNGVCALMALSSTGIVAFAVVCLALLPRVLTRIPRRIGRGALLGGALTLGAVALAIGLTLTMTSAPDIIAKVLDDLILNKSGSASGMERTAWAMGGLEALRDTWGLGAGTGSIRSNGLLFVLLGSVGILGTAAFLAFLWFAFSGKAAPGGRATLANARIAALAVLVSMLLAATVPDPGIPLVLLAAIAVSARRVQPSAEGAQEAHLAPLAADA